MKNGKTFTLLGHEISMKPSIDNLSGARYDDVIERINELILNGEDEGDFESFGIEYEWKIQTEPTLTTIWLLKEYDQWFTASSSVTLGVFSSFDNALNAIKKDQGAKWEHFCENGANQWMSDEQEIGIMIKEANLDEFGEI